MIGSDIYVFWKNSTGGCMVSRRKTDAYTMPVLSEYQNSSIISNATMFSPSPNKLSCSISRPNSDIPILSDSTKFIWAVGDDVLQPDTSDSSFSRHSLKGQFSSSFSFKEPLVFIRKNAQVFALENETSKGWSNFQSSKFFDHIEKVILMLIFVFLA